jgi:ADP-heptose:LPS heptosyltransferase
VSSSTEKRWALSTKKLGDTLCLYSVLRHAPQAVHLPFTTTYKNLFSTWPLQPGGAIWNAPDRFMELYGVEHVIDRLADTYGVERSKLQPFLWERPTHEGYIALCPHAMSKYREWSHSYWMELAAHLDAVKLPYRWFYGNHRHGDALPFDAFVEGISKARCVIGVDSGHVHLADGFGVPVIGLYGAVASRHWGAYHFRRFALDGSDKSLRPPRFWPPVHLIDRIHPLKVIERLNEVLSTY